MGSLWLKLAIMSAMLVTHAAPAIAQTYVYSWKFSGIPQPADSGGEEETPDETPSEPTPPGSAAIWAQFATDNNVDEDETWNVLSWGNEGLTSLPAEPYPNANPTGNVYLHRNTLTHVNSLSSIISVGGMMNLSNSGISDISGLSNLTSVTWGLNLSGNQITDTSALSNLSGNIYSLRIEENNITSLSGLSGITGVEGNFDLEDNAFTTLDGLENLRVVRNVKLRNNPNLVDISALGGLTGYEYKWDFQVNLDPGIHLRPGFVPIPSQSWVCQPEQSGAFESITPRPATQAEACGL